ncbi:MAG: hypothetical protein HRT57_08060, partial [Crocinitomicaceae bacterium]|nr:hypothetical protein [Crocinitomicaceae bacterium]
MKFILSTLTLLILNFSVFGNTEYPVSWNALRNSDVSGSTITKSANSNGFGIGVTDQILFTRGEASVSDGYFKYTPTGVTNSPWNNETKVIGFSPINDPDVRPNDIVYGFSFGRNNRLRAFSPEGQVTQTYSSLGFVKLERVGNTLEYSVDGTVVYSVIVSTQESLEIKAKLTSSSSSFSNVVTNYNTTPFLVDALIDNPNKIINLSVTGTFPPYSFVWDLGDPSGKLRTFIEGPNWVTITDSQRNRVRRMYSIGSLASWTNLNQSIVNQEANPFEPVHDILSSTAPNNKWGTATHNSSFTDNSTSWVEYIIESESRAAKALGFIDESTNVTRTRNLKAGFIISRRNLQVIENGSVVLSTVYMDKDVLNISYSDGDVNWSVNGDVIYSSSYAKNGPITIAGLVKNNGTLRDVNYSSDQPSLINSIWDELTQTGQIDVDISSITGVVGPFHYMISNEAIPHLDDTYHFLKDTILIDVDSIDFYTGINPLTTHSFTALEAGTYHITVFDSQGNRLFAKEIHIQGILSFDNQTDLISIESPNEAEVKSNADGAFGSLELYSYEGLNSQFRFEPKRRNKDQFIGYADESIVVNSYADLVYGFYLSKRRLYTVENGVLSSEFTILRRNEDLLMSTDNGTLKLSTSNEELASFTLPAEFTYKIGVGADSGVKIKVAYGPKVKKSKYKFKSIIIQNLDCQGQTGSFSFSINPIANLNGLSTVYSIVHLETGTQIVTNAVAFDNNTSIPPITTDGLGNPL